MPALLSPDPDLGLPPRPPLHERLILAKELTAILGVSIRTLDRWLARHPSFPRPCETLGRVRRWRHSDIDAWIRARH